MGKNEPEYETKQTVKNYLDELRKIEKEKIKNAEKIGELKERIREINAINEEIKEIEQNNPVKIDKETLAKALKGKVAKFLRDNTGNLIIGAGTTSVGLIGSILTALGLKGYLEGASKKIRKLGEILNIASKVMKKTSKTIDNITKYPYQTVAAILRMFGYLTKETYGKPIAILAIIVVLFIVFIIKRWRGKLIRLK